MPVQGGSMKSNYKYIVLCMFILIATYIVARFVATKTTVNGSSMYNTLEDGDRVIINKIAYTNSEPERFDIIVFKEDFSKNGYFIKRIIGLPGETIRIDLDGNIYIDGELLDEDYGYKRIIDPGLAETEITIGEDEYFVLGDNRNNSEDSRFPRVGNVKKDQIVGKVEIRYWPFIKFGYIDLYKDKTEK